MTEPISDTIWNYMITNHCSEQEAKNAIRKQLRDSIIAEQKRMIQIENERISRLYKY